MAITPGEADMNDLENQDLAQLLSIPEPTLPDHSNAEGQTEFCPIHPDATICACNSFLGDWDIEGPDILEPASADLIEPDYSRFENWIPRFVRPEKPCDYCRSRRLDCYQQRGEPRCNACINLFRECSFTRTNTLESNNQNTRAFLDTLHLIDEDAAKERGTLTGIKTLKSKGVSNTAGISFKDDAPGSSKRNGIRFPRHAVKTLRDWLDAHADNPYPSEGEKIELEKQTELKPTQIANWLANARRRRKATEKSKPKLSMSPSLRPSSSAIEIPRALDKPWDELNPLERWKHSPPENEPATILDIYNAVQNSEYPDDDVSASPSTLGRSSKRRKGSSNGSAWSVHRAPSTTSQETGQTSSLSASSAAISNSNVSSHSTHGSFSSFNSSLAGKKDRRRRRRPAAMATGRKLSDDRKRIFQCTFCTDTFKSKYDWTRHEKSLHLSLEKWICAPLGPVVTDQESGSKQCVYCGLHNPSADHVASHNHQQCEDKGLDARTFYRKDHLRQHLRLMHGCEITSLMDSSKSIAMFINSRCGFCAQRFSIWQERVDHLTAHFKAGARMADWKGCRGLDPAVAAQVTNAMPPYLIGMESASPNPFSATNRATWRHDSEFGDVGELGQSRAGDTTLQEGTNYDRRATCWEILTVRLGKYAREMADKQMVMTDEMLQRRARLILYDSDDSWNQTAADNPEWLDLFKKAHGLNFIPSTIGGSGSEVPEDLETYGDLGLRIPFAVQLQAYNAAQTGAQRDDAGSRPGPYQQARDNLMKLWQILSKEGVLEDVQQSCQHIECLNNLIDISRVDGKSSPGPRQRRWCNKRLSIEAAEQVASFQAINGCRTPSAADNRAMAMKTLWDLEDRVHQHDGSCSAAFDKQAAANAKARGLQILTQQENVACPWQQYNEQSAVLAERRARCLSELTKREGRECVDCPDSIHPAKSQLPYLKRHKYELTLDRARLFETTTAAWTDCGSMPPAVQTSSLLKIPETTSTGATMEFIGDDLGSESPFSNDALTSELQMQHNTEGQDNWQLPGGGTMSSAEMMEMINATTTDQDGLIPDATAMGLDWNQPMTTSDENIANLPNSDDFSFDDLIFDDGTFDMPLDGDLVLDSGITQDESDGRKHTQTDTDLLGAMEVDTLDM